jgi:peptidoglycan/LPS O-acetylase OafA/YrhL
VVTTPPPGGSSRRIPGLDVVRVLAIVLVMGRHLPDYATASPRVRQLLAIWHEGGWIGVDIFFVLSGFLIGSILLENLVKVSVAGGAIAVGALVLRVAQALRHPGFDLYTHMYPSHLRIDALFSGVVLACLWQNHRQWFQRLRGFEGALLAAGILLLAPPFVLPMEHPVIDTVGFTSNALGAVLLMVAALLWDSHRPSVRAIAWLGPYTYSIYLWHIVVVRTVSVLLSTASYGVVFGLYVAGSLIAGVGMAKAIEAPALALRERLIPRGEPPPARIIEGTPPG